MRLSWQGQEGNRPMHGNLHFLLGLPFDAGWSRLAEEYERLMESLDLTDSDEDDSPKAQIARQRLKNCYESHKQVESQNQFYTPLPETAEAGYCRPKIGELLVAFGILSLSELDSALEIQLNTRHEHVPLGQLLVAAGYLNQMQLDYYLRMQRIFKLPPDNPEAWGQRLVELGLVSEDQLKIALIEQQTTNCSLREAFINRGWLTAELLDRIF